MPEWSLGGIAHFVNVFASRMGAAYILVLVALSLALLVRQFGLQRTVWKTHAIIIVLFIATTSLHMLFAKTDHFWRYESYLVTLGTFTIAVAARDYWFKNAPTRFDRSLSLRYIVVLLLVCLVALPLGYRCLWSHKSAPQATTNIYEQQYQMGLFLKDFYEGEAVAANDIGAINLLADIRCLDLVGLGTMEVVRARPFITATMQDLARDRKVKLAIVYDHWFGGHKAIPDSWTRVGQWTIQNNEVCGGTTVSFYAVEPGSAGELIENLKDFSPRLPPGVEESGEYTLE